MSIENKVVLITGASSGLGEATARHLAERGAKLTLAARRQDKLETIADELRAKGTEVEVVQTDVTDRQQVQAMVDRTVDRFERMDVIINNAGLMAIAPLDETKVDEWDKMIDINIKGVLYGIASALPVFRKQQSGHFINLSSVAGIKVSAPGGTVYSGTKYAVRAITDGLRAEVGEHIRTTSIEPGAVESELKYGTSHDQSAKAVEKLYEQAIPADSVARAIAYAIEQPTDVDINEIVLRPTSQEF
ncbi:SDR family oxidoreductase [Paracoccus sp. 1_MG-2023]|uniref:SDR family oxidoreductase n=1 Tax=unclassified Paracoccus (in: a-proteobacteria) TaxID=2688777 RepID=UPI001C09B114|nr:MULTISPECIES: SDR family oxidoreductase [unclassified Paracoccus (in: a-proteobacteria)]MBU2956101.1 SDR family oxidoreductase [Paracoccus sp. C2R09]MDO6669507.1 SDR family oxidoreductase [Paracoccus sp. 1_MG-2023]